MSQSRCIFEVFEVTTSAAYTASRNMKVGCTWDTSREGCLRKKVIVLKKNKFEIKIYFYFNLHFKSLIPQIGQLLNHPEAGLQRKDLCHIF